MSQPREAVIEFGPAGEPGEPVRQRRGVSGAFLASLAGDRRVVPLTAGLGALALFASLVSEWQVTTFDSSVLESPGSGARPVPATVAEVAGWGPAYLVGLFLLVTAVVLAVTGPVGGREYARLGALSVGGVLLVVLLAAYSALGEKSQALGPLAALGYSGQEMRIAVGRGVWCALVGVLLVTMAAYLSGRRPRDEEPAAEREPVPGEPDEWAPEAPFELEVSPAKPWAVTGGTRDEPGDGISG